MHQRSISVLLLVLAMGAFTSSAKASPVDVTFAVNIQINLPALAVTTFTGSGTLTTRFDGTPGSHASPGPIELLGGDAFLTGNFTVLGDVITGFQNVLFLPGGLGSASLGGGFSLNAVGGIVSGQIHCTGATCSLAGLPASVPQPLTGGTVAFALAGQLIGFPSLGPISFNASGSGGTFGGQQLTAVVVGQEIDRVHVPVPEPSTATLLGLGLVALLATGGGAARLRRK